jgi:hypothetical protein
MMNPLLLYAAGLLCLGVLGALLCRVRVPGWVAGTAAGIGLAVFLAYPLVTPPRSVDIEWFWKGGVSLRNGESPYINPGVQNPPTAFPLYLAVSSFPLEITRILWTAVLVVGALLLVETARRALAASGDGVARNLGWKLTTILTAVVCLSRTTRYGLDLGQLAIPITLCCFVIFWAWGAHQRVVAGAGLAVVSVKTPTMIPLLLLFPRWKDRLAWVAMAVTGLALVLFTTAPQDIIPRCRECLANIAANRAPGKIDDPSLAGSNTSGLIGVGMLIHRLGVPAEAAGVVELLALLAGGVWVFRQIWGPNALSRPASACLLALYASVFLYHRHYDMVLLALPLVHVAGRIRSESGLRRALYVGVALSVLVVFNIDIWALSHLNRQVVVGEDAIAWLLRALVLPVMTWLNLLSMVLLTWAERTPAGVQEWRSDRTADPTEGAVQATRIPEVLVGAGER